MKTFYLQAPGWSAGDPRIACGNVQPAYDEERHEWVMGDGLTRVTAWEPSEYELVFEGADDPAQVPFPALTPMQFYLAFTTSERIAIKQSQDPLVQEFWATYELAVSTGSMIDPNLVSVHSGLDYLRSIDILAADGRVEQILAGVPQ